jgi:alpha-galactosidase
VFCSVEAAASEPIKVYILAGQSNMEGHARVETFDYIGDDPATTPLLKEMLDSAGEHRVCDNVWISYLTGSGDRNGEGVGKLTTGYGARRDPSQSEGKIGPEFTFGISMDKGTSAPILIIKTAWGGKSLHTDFRPPSAGPYQFGEREVARYEGEGKHMAQIQADKDAATGHYYRLMINHVKSVLGDIGRVCPDYSEDLGFEIAGFVWFQAWNDMVDGGVYPNRGEPGGYDKYSECMAHFIRDVRHDLSAPDMDFVIGVVGVGGALEKYENQNNRTVHANFRAAMSAPADLPEFRGNVMAVQTAPYWDEPLAAIDMKRGKVNQMAYYLRTMNPNHANKDGTMSDQEQKAFVDHYRAELISPQEEATWQRGASNAGYHYLGCAKTMALIGRAFSEAMFEMHQQE